MITRFYLPLLSTNVKHPKFGCHVTSLCQGLRRSARSGGEDPENQVEYRVSKKTDAFQIQIIPMGPQRTDRDLVQYVN